MRIVVIGLGIQGKKRIAVAGKECIATVDCVKEDADYSDISEVPLSSYDAALVCTPDTSKLPLLEYLLSHKKHLLVEKPLLASTREELEKIAALAQENKVVCYTAYNHRFEPHFVRMREMIQSEKLGELYHCRLFYGNGTARDVRNSPWRDKEGGVFPDLGSHLLDTLLFWFGEELTDAFHIWRCHNFENQSPDHLIMGCERSSGIPSIDLEMTLLSWRNHFTCDLIGERGSVHIESLCKWGPSTFTLRHRVLPSGRPPEESITLIQSDPTWALEYTHFKKLCEHPPSSTLAADLFINSILQGVLR